MRKLSKIQNWLAAILVAVLATAASAGLDVTEPVIVLT